MNKIAIAGAGAMMIGLGIAPFTGVFAATSQTNTVTVSVTDSCSMAVTAGTNGSTEGTTNTYAVNISNGGKAENFGGTQVSVTCNSPTGWKLQAAGNGGTTLTTTSGGAPIATGTVTSGDVSSWAFKVSGSGASSSYTGFTEVPASATTVASGSGVVNGNVIIINYQVYIGNLQAAGVYTGGVTYTISKGQS